MNTSENKSTFALILFIICSFFTLCGIVIVLQTIVFNNEAMSAIELYGKGKISIGSVYAGSVLICLIMLIKCMGSYFMYNKKLFGFIFYIIPNAIFLIAITFPIIMGIISFEIILCSCVTLVMIILHLLAFISLKQKNKNSSIL